MSHDDDPIQAAAGPERPGAPRTQRAHDELARLLPPLAVKLRIASLLGPRLDEAAELTPNQVFAVVLVASTEGARLRAGEIARRLGISFPAATAMVDRLVDAGVVERTRGDDRRVVWVSLTHAGATLVERVQSGLRSRAAAAFAQMDPAAQDALMDAIRRVTSFTDRMAMADAGTLGSASPGSEQAKAGGSQ